MIDIGNAHFFRHVFESTVMHVPIQGILAADRAVGDIDVRPAVAIKIYDRYRGAHRGHFRHDGIEFGIEHRSLMNEIDARGMSDFLEMKTIASQGGAGIRGRSGRLLPRRDPLDHQGGTQEPEKKDTDQNSDDPAAGHWGRSLRNEFRNTSGVT